MTNTQNKIVDLSGAEHDVLFEISLSKLMDEISMADSSHNSERLALTKQVLKNRIEGVQRS